MTGSKLSGFALFVNRMVIVIGLAYAVGPLFAALVAAAFGEFALGGRLVAIQVLMWLLAVIYAVGRKS